MDISNNNISCLCAQILREKLKNNFNEAGLATTPNQQNSQKTIFGLLEMNYFGNLFSVDDCSAIDSYLKHNRECKEMVRKTNYSFKQIEYAKKGKLLKLDSDLE